MTVSVEIIENNNTYKIQIEPSETKTFTLTPVKVGEEAEGYYVSAYQPTPNRIQITGALPELIILKKLYWRLMSTAHLLTLQVR